ncbi:TadE/TadG family type IV pilus assembly protein [Lacibacterium aquatile]|uniref:TadE/TadG family type IV pilus assembly protein n=1 Tax=Lacibacterium aquatile TaxID=1168082 RepID=A0ABW5DSJ3_9PROT
MSKLDTEGAAAVEFALIAPVLLMAVLIGADLARAWMQRAEVEHGTRLAARHVAALADPFGPDAVVAARLIAQSAGSSRAPLAGWERREALFAVRLHEENDRRWLEVEAAIPYVPLLSAFSRFMPDGIDLKAKVEEPLLNGR